MNELCEEDDERQWECHVCGHVDDIEWLITSPFDDGTEVGYDLPVPARCTRCAAPRKRKIDELGEHAILALIRAMYGWDEGNLARASDHIPNALLKIYAVDDLVIDQAIEASVVKYRHDPNHVYQILAVYSERVMVESLSIDETELSRLRSLADRIAGDARSGFLEWRLRELGDRLKTQSRLERDHHRELWRRRQRRADV